MKKFPIIAILSVIFLIILFPVINNAFAATNKSSQIIKYRISQNATEMAITGDLKYYGFIKHESALKLALFTKGKLFGKEIKRSSVYEISQSMNAWQLASVLLNRGTTVDCNHGCPDANFEPELLPGGDLAPTLKEKYSWVKTYDDCIKAIGHDGGQVTSEQAYQRTGHRICNTADGRYFVQGKEGYTDYPPYP